MLVTRSLKRASVRIRPLSYSQKAWLSSRRPASGSWKKPQIAVLATSSSVNNYTDDPWNLAGATASLMLLAAAAAAAFSSSDVTCCDDVENKDVKINPSMLPHAVPPKSKQFHLTPAAVGQENIDDAVEASSGINSMPVYTSDQVAENDGSDGKPVWMSYGGVVYDVTNFVQNHPGGSEFIMKAAGTAIEPFWHIYRQHFASDLPILLMEHMAIGRLTDEDQDVIDEQLAVLQETSDDPYAYEPERDERLIVHSDTPMNAECPGSLLTESYFTPSSLFYIRHHHPVPILTQHEVDHYEVQIDLSAYGKGLVKLPLAELKKMKKVEVSTTLQCSGNRRNGYNTFARTSGTMWGQGAISTAKWGGVRLADVMKWAGVDDPFHAELEAGMEHVRFHSLDGMMASIGVEKAFNPYGDVILAYEMNDQPLPRDHGFPLRVIVPGYAAVRNVKWIRKIELAKEEAEGPWQRGLNYKALPPNIKDVGSINVEEMPSITESSVFSGITTIEGDESAANAKPGDEVFLHVSGWAWAGGGRNIVRVDVTSNDGESWSTAKLTQGATQRFGRAWAWTFWECIVPCKIQENGQVYLASKAVDMAFNVQPEHNDHNWNVRGLGNNSWFRVKARVC